MELQPIRRMQKTIMIIMATILISPLILGSTTKLYPSNDAFVRDSSPNENFGIGTWSQDLRTGYNINFGIDRSYFKFDLSGLQGKTINSAIFSIDPVFYQGNPLLNLYSVSDNNWDERTITWNNAPSHNILINSKEITNLDRAEFNIDNSYLGANEFSFVLIEDNENTDVVFDSKDYFTGNPGDETRWPYLEIDYNGDGCNTNADVDCNGCVEMNELLDFISEWKLGNAQMSELLNGISMWKLGAGC